jgi:hypothetical protein
MSETEDRRSTYEAPVVTDLGRIEDITQMPKGGTIADGQGAAKSI